MSEKLDELDTVPSQNGTNKNSSEWCEGEWLQIWRWDDSTMPRSIPGYPDICPSVVSRPGTD